MKMMRVNGVEQAIPEGAMIFDDFIQNLTATLSKEQMVIARVKVDGQEITDTDGNIVHTKNLSEIGDIEVETASPADLAYETLNTLEIYTNRLIMSIERSAIHYKGKNLVTADAYFSKSVDGMELFIQTISGIKLALRIGLNQKIALTEAALVSVMNDLLEAKRQNNYVFLAELLEKDLIENLTEWKTVIFPVFRAWKTS